MHWWGEFTMWLNHGPLRGSGFVFQFDDLLGHSRTSTTKDLYGHVMPEDLTAASEATGRGIAWGDR